jgi:hypothetical protein
MLTDADLELNGKFHPDELMALTWVIDGDCLYDIPLKLEHSKMFLENDEVIDISELYPANDKITVRFMKNGQILEDFQTSEYFGSILLSNPLVLDLVMYPYGRYVHGTNAKFDGNQFIILDRDMEGLMPWKPGWER